MNPVHLKLGRERGGVPIAALRAFEAAATLGSFKAAAADLGLTASAISHHVRDLEDAFGEPLFDRQHRRVVLTDTGERLAEVLRPAFARIVEAYHTQVRAPVRIRLSAAPLFANAYLLPHFDRLRSRLPRLDLRLEISVQPLDLEGQDDLIVLRYGPKVPAGVMSRRIAASPLIVVGAAGFAGGKNLRAVLASGPLLTLSSQRSAWRRVFPDLVEDAPQLVFDSFEGIIQAANAGRGLALVPLLVASKAIASGRLARIGDLEIKSGWDYRLMTANRSAAARLLGQLADELKAILCEDQVDDQGVHRIERANDGRLGNEAENNRGE